MPDPPDCGLASSPARWPAVVFQPLGRRVPAAPGSTLMDLARAAGVDLAGPCGGQGLCGKCQVRLDLPDPPPPQPGERAVLGQAAEQGFRLACQTTLPQGGSVWVPFRSRPGRQVILTQGAGAPVELDPAVRCLDLTVPPASLESPTDQGQRLLQELGPHLAGSSAELSLGVLRGLPQALAEQGGRVAAALWQGRRVLDVSPGQGQPCLGLAVDLGTTTVVAYLADLASGAILAVTSAMNPQIAHGEDVVSRIAFAGRDPQNLEALAGLARACVNELAREACAQAGVPPARVLDCVLVGNTAMHHLFLGLDPTGLALAPYAPVTGAGLDLPARQVGLELAGEAALHLPPVKAGFVGSDTVAAALALGAGGLGEPTLILDLGTNGEMVLAAGGRMLCCSAAAGPAFEGGHIAWGMRAATGAVEAVCLGTDLEPSLKVIGGGPPLGLCGSGVVSAVAGLLQAGALNGRGSFVQGLASPRLRPGPRGLEFVLAWAGQTASGQDLVLTAQDVAEVQLAKAAVHAGVAIMLERLGLTRVERALLAGAFGNYLDPGAAGAIGLFPGARAEIITGVGNAAGAGALAALLNRWRRAQAQDLARGLGYLELAACPQFAERFVEGMALPQAGGDG
ncbi:MAG: DUF4445 domain-containing protein [Desulfarculus sp.]|nr:DUF4445 domain-containing protein [Desulfarculus sp.]